MQRNYRGRGGAIRRNVREREQWRTAEIYNKAVVPEIPPPPILNPNDPLAFPFPTLKLYDGTQQNYDEQLLRALYDFISGRQSAELRDVFENMEKHFYRLMERIYHSPPHLWAYLLCYPEHFSIDRDPRYPYRIWFNNNSKMTPKSKAHRYQRDLESGKIKFPINDEQICDTVRYDVDMERRAASVISAIFWQADIRDSASIPFIITVLHYARFTMLDIYEYMGDIEHYILRRPHFFEQAFGDQVTERTCNYVNAIRLLSNYVFEKGGSCSIKEILHFFQFSVMIKDKERKAVGLDRYCRCDDFLLLLHKHKLIFRLLSRQSAVQLRHHVVPDISPGDIFDVPPFPKLDLFTGMKEKLIRDPPAVARRKHRKGEPDEEQDVKYKRIFYLDRPTDDSKMSAKESKKVGDALYLFENVLPVPVAHVEEDVEESLAFCNAWTNRSYDQKEKEEIYGCSSSSLAGWCLQRARNLPRLVD